MNISSKTTAPPPDGTSTEASQESKTETNATSTSPSDMAQVEVDVQPETTFVIEEHGDTLKVQLPQRILYTQKAVVLVSKWPEGPVVRYLLKQLYRAAVGGHKTTCQPLPLAIREFLKHGPHSGPEQGPPGPVIVPNNSSTVTLEHIVPPNRWLRVQDTDTLCVEAQRIGLPGGSKQLDTASGSKDDSALESVGSWNKGLGLSPRDKRITLTKAWRKLFDEEYGYSRGYPLPLEAYISFLVRRVPYPSPGSALEVHLVPGYCPAVLKRPQRVAAPTFRGSALLLLLALPPETIIDVLLLILMERKIVFVSSTPTLISEITEALLSMLFPLTWVFAYIPSCPTSLIGLLDAPTPFILGIDPSALPPLEAIPDELYVVDLDSGTAFLGPGRLPPHCYTRGSRKEAGRRIDIPESIRQWMRVRLENAAQQAGIVPGFGKALT